MKKNNTPVVSLIGAFLWGYGHFAVFASAAAVTDQIQHNSEIGIVTANACVAVPAAAYLLALWFIHELPAKRTGH